MRQADLLKGRVIARLVRRFNYHSILDIKESDTVIIGYPKSGTTWFQNLVAGALIGIDTHFLPDKLMQEIVPDLDFKIFYKRHLDNMVFFTHQTPRPGWKKIIYLVRDPRDTMASYMAMVKGLNKGYTEADVVSDRKYLYFGPWQDHVDATLSNPHGAEILIVRFEDLRADPLPELRRVIEFLGLERSDEILMKSIVGNNMASMKKKELTLGFDKTIIDRKKWGEGSMFNRKGQVGFYEKDLSSDAIRTIEREAQAQMELFGYSPSAVQR